MAALERGAGPEKHQNNSRYGSPQLQNPTDVRERVLGISAGVQSDPVIDGTGRLASRRIATSIELQAYAADLGSVESTAVSLRIRRRHSDFV